MLFNIDKARNIRSESVKEILLSIPSVTDIELMVIIADLNVKSMVFPGVVLRRRITL